MPSKPDSSPLLSHVACSQSALASHGRLDEVDNSDIKHCSDDFKNFFKYIAKKEDDRDLLEQERDRKADEKFESLQKAIVEAIKPPSSQDVKTKFWNAYRTISEEHDNEFRAKYNGDLDTSLIFAGLFSAVSSAFIIQVQSSLQQNPDDVTQALLRILIHSVNSSVFSGPDLIIPEWNGPPAGIVAVESILYISFFATLLVALLSVLGKQWLTYYASVGMRGTIEERGIERQKKFDGFRRWGFEYVMQALPMLLQISLLLFSAAVTIYLWTLQRKIAGVILGLSLLGVVLYLVFVLSHIFAVDSPFRTPVSIGLLKIPWVKNTPQSVVKLFKYVRSLRHQKVKLHSLGQPLHLAAPGRREEPRFEPQTTSNRDEYGCLAVLWMLDTSTEPDVVAAAASIAIALQWSPNINFIPPLTRLRDTFMACFHGSPGLRLRESAGNHAIACGQAYYHLEIIQRSMQSAGDEAEFPADFFRRVTIGGSKTRPFESAELNLVYSLLLGETFPTATHSSFSPSFFRWALHVSPYHFYFLPTNGVWYPSTPDLVHSSGPGDFDRSSFTNMLLYLGGSLGFPLNGCDLAVMNKSTHCEKLLGDLLQYLAQCYKRAGFLNRVSEVFEIIIISMKKIDSPLDLSYSRYKDHIRLLCKTLPNDETSIRGLERRSRSSAAFHALQLLSTFQKDRPKDLTVLHPPITSSGHDEEWEREVTEMIYKRLDEFDINDKWEDSVMHTIEGHLQVLIEVPHFGRCKPSYNLVCILLKFMSPDNNSREALRHLTYSVVWFSRDYWFDDEDLRPMLQELNTFSGLRAVVDKHSRYEPSYMQMVGKLSTMPTWVPIIQYDLPRWISLYDLPARFIPWDMKQNLELRQNVMLAVKNMSSAHAETSEQIETEDSPASLLMAMENIWTNFNFSVRIAIESFCPLVECAWTSVHAAAPYRAFQFKALEKPLITRLRSAIRHARNSLLEKRPRDEMDQEEVETVEAIAKELAEIEEYLGRDEIHGENRDTALGKQSRTDDDYVEICSRLDRLDASLLQLLTQPRRYLGTI